MLFAPKRTLFSRQYRLLGLLCIGLLWAFYPKRVLREGDRVATEGLQIPSRNGMTGTLLKYDGTSRRWQVLLDGEEKRVMIRSLNLVAICDEHVK